MNAHLGLFDEVMATTAGCNLTGSAKADRLRDHFGEGRFEYVANGKVDLAVWRMAAASVTVNAPRHVVREVESLGRPHCDLPGAPVSLRAWLRAVRLHQWTKNALLFVPLIMARRIFDPSALFAVSLAFLAFGLAASATYIINDLFDLQSDRHHSKKKHRPFAAGVIPANTGAIVAIVLLGCGVALALLLPRPRPAGNAAAGCG